MRVVVTGGGSGGHIYPALAVVEALRSIDPDSDPAFVGGTSGMEANIVPESGVQFIGVATRKIRKLASLSTIGALVALLKGYGEASRFLRSFQPGAVISTGGYVAAATALAAGRLRIPTIVIAPDAVPGRTNLLAARRAACVCIMFEETRTAFPKPRVELTGLPIRSGIVSSTPAPAARQSLGLDADRFTVLVTGGSQGARRLNEIVSDAIPLFPSDLQILHQTGAGNAALSEQTARQEYDNRYLMSPYLDSVRMELAYAAANLTICRSGVGSLAEAAANGLPMLMVPLPTAYADHQTHNAQAMERAGAGILLSQAGLTAESLAAAVTGLINDRERLAAFSRASRSQGRPEAALRVARIALDSAM